jgi:tRNA dimethylallyltransferase
MPVTGKIEVRAGTAVVLLAGPTASGKSTLALELAARHDGIVVNADSMQVYGDLRVLSARPSEADEAAAEHRLYGHVSAATRYSVGRWLADIAPVLAEARKARRLAIVVGGTGLYFKALTEGLAAVPEIPGAVRSRILAEAEKADTSQLHERLQAVDPEDAAVIRLSDRSRIIRALEVFEATGRSLAVWNRAGASPPLVAPEDAARMVLVPDRAELHRRIAERAGRMMRGGARGEVERLMAQGLGSSLPAMKAIGVRELCDHIAGSISLEEATAAIATETRRYARRQLTWFRNQMQDWPSVDPG